MSKVQMFEALVGWLIRAVGQSDRADIGEDQAIAFIKDEFSLDRVGAIAEWQALSSNFRQSKVVREGHLVQWQIFRNSFHIMRLATAEEMLSTAEIYQQTTAEEVGRKIRSLTGAGFEQFLGAVLARKAEYRNIRVTQASRDGGIDFRGNYASSDLESPLVGQAKQVSNPIGAAVARDFIGALDTCGEKRVIGLLVSTGGFTNPAIQALSESRFHIMRWGFEELLSVSRGIATRQIDVSFEVLDQTFWDEIVG